jgi:hypothetical protein
MLHELWIGEDRDASWRQRLVGTIQKYIILEFVRALRPRVVHTSNTVYAAQLAGCGFKAEVLPLFGNVPVYRGAATCWYAPYFAAAGADLLGAQRIRYWLFAMFGALHPVWPPEPLFGCLQSAAAAQQKQVVIAAIGRMGPGKPLWQEMKTKYADRLTFVELGPRPLEEISEFLQSADFGIATTPYDLIGKSGSAIAMLEHGLPVIANRVDPHSPAKRAVDEYRSQPLIVKMDERLAERLPHLRRNQAKSRLETVAGQFVQALDVHPAVEDSTLQAV